MNRPLSEKSWQYRQLNAQTPGLDALSDALLELVQAGEPVVAGTADLQYSNGLAKFARECPERFVQFGISEQNMVSAAAGMAAVGLKPYVATFASFLALLCCEQIRMDVAYSALPVRLIGHHAGISLGFYGTSHHATEDLAIARSIAGLTVVAPADGAQLASVIAASADYAEPIYIRTQRGRDPVVYQAGKPFVFGKAIKHLGGKDLVIIACGSTVHPALQAAKALNAKGHSVGLLDMATVKPIDSDAILEAATNARMVLTVEEHNVLGGLGGAVAEVIAGEGLPVKLRRHGIHDEYSLIAPPTHLYAHYKLDSAGIEEIAAGLLA
ncbi:transketolase family protein [Mesorhizobium escarrei]|uniref:Transketolase C-terminal section n=1 Tax=Mesorhizobium escarrei TaxID=666018 RepID=A0ABM9EFE6_9HYPH|nr:transketolase C-terminal domain-containing protein [Mesorhizobium escarrei]CAH2408087.1 Putative transketolase C-terminal section [Mesorhizobium escarrei]